VEVKVSVIIPTYNRAKFLEEAINSVLNQTYKDFEIIVVDDGSTDNTKEIIRKFGEIIYIYQKNKGVSSARNKGIKMSRGEYIAFLDSDDLWLKRKLEKQMKIFEKYPENKICHTNEIWIRDGKRINQGKRHQKYGGYIFDKVLPLCIISPSSVVIKREVFEKVGLFDERLKVCEDYDMWLRICAHYKVYFLDEPLIIKRGGHKDQLSKKYWGLDRFRIYALRKILKDKILTEDQRSLVKKEIVKKAKIVANGAKKRWKLLRWLKYELIAAIYSTHT